MCKIIIVSNVKIVNNKSFKWMGVLIIFLFGIIIVYVIFGKNILLLKKVVFRVLVFSLRMFWWIVLICC